MNLKSTIKHKENEEAKAIKRENLIQQRRFGVGDPPGEVLLGQEEWRCLGGRVL